jgi:hypothetical protein
MAVSEAQGETTMSRPKMLAASTQAGHSRSRNVVLESGIVADAPCFWDLIQNPR